MLLDTFVNKGYFNRDFSNIFLAYYNAKLPKTLTFKDLYEHSKINLHIYTVNISDYKLKF